MSSEELHARSALLLYDLYFDAIMIRKIEESLCGSKLNISSINRYTPPIAPRSREDRHLSSNMDNMAKEGVETVRMKSLSWGSGTRNMNLNNNLLSIKSRDFLKYFPSLDKAMQK